MNPAYHQIATDVILFCISAAVGIYLWINRRSQVNASRIDELESKFCKRMEQLSERAAEEDKDLQEQISDLSDRVSQVEGSRPTLDKLSRDIGAVHSRIDETKDIVSRLEGEYRASKGTLDLIHQYLLNQGRAQP